MAKRQHSQIKSQAFGGGGGEQHVSLSPISVSVEADVCNLSRSAEFFILCFHCNRNEGLSLTGWWGSCRNRALREERNAASGDFARVCRIYKADRDRGSRELPDFSAEDPSRMAESSKLQLFVKVRSNGVWIQDLSHSWHSEAPCVFSGRFHYCSQEQKKNPRESDHPLIQHPLVSHSSQPESPQAAGLVCLSPTAAIWRLAIISNTYVVPRFQCFKAIFAKCPRSGQQMNSLPSLVQQ